MKITKLSTDLYSATSKPENAPDRVMLVDMGVNRFARLWKRNGEYARLEVVSADSPKEAAALRYNDDADTVALVERHDLELLTRALEHLEEDD